MIATLAFSLVASALVLVAGRKDRARDPRLTVSLLILLAAFPLMAAFMPKVGFLPVKDGLPSNAGLPWGGMLAGVWLVGFAWAMARFGLALAALHDWVKRSCRVAIEDGVEIRTLDGLPGPVAAGISHPVILVPTSWHDWSGDYRRVVITHELAHHRRRDPLWRLLAELACAVHWFNPLVRWMTHRLVMQCEYACDAMVLGRGIEAKTYASVLCDFASPNSPSLLAPAMAEAGPLEHRVRRMLAPERAPNGKLLVLLALLGVLTACSLSMIGGRDEESAEIPASEIELRWAANPFPTEP